MFLTGFPAGVLTKYYVTISGLSPAICGRVSHSGDPGEEKITSWTNGYLN